MEPPFWWKVPGRSNPDGDACVAAARAGHMPVVRFLLGRGYPLDVDATVAAVMRHCDLADALWLLAQEPVRCLPAYTGGELPKAVVQAAVSGCTEHDFPSKLEWLMAHFSDGIVEVAPSLIEAVVKSDVLPALKSIIRRICGGGCSAEETGTVFEFSLMAAAAAGSAAVTAWLLSQEAAAARPVLGHSSLAMACVRAAEGGHVPVLRLVLPRILPMVPQAGEFPALDVMATCALLALKGGHVGAMECLWEQAAGSLSPQQAFRMASTRLDEAGSAEAARWLWIRLPQLIPQRRRTSALRDAAEAGKVPLMAFFREELGAEWPYPFVMASAAVACAVSGRDGLAVLRWLHERGCPLECFATTLQRAVSHGDVAIVEWLLGKGVVIREQLASDTLLPEAARSGCGAMVEWLVAAGCPMGRIGVPYLAAGQRGDLEMLRCLRRLGVPWGRNSLLRVLEGGARVPVHAVRWMVEEGGAPCDKRAVERAAVRYPGAEGAALQECMRRAAGVAGRGRKG